MRIIKNKYIGASTHRRPIRAYHDKYVRLASKDILDSDGFNTEYTLYSTSDGDYYFCMFGDSDVYGPDPNYADFETWSEDEAWEWYNSYDGFADEDIYGAVEEEPYEEYTGEHDQYEDVWDEIKDIDQEFTSENTSINAKNLPAIFNMVSFEPGTVNVDYGGGRYNNVAEYLTKYDVVNMVLDPFNRSKAHNREVINLVRDHGGADTATCSNVLNVIKEPENRMQVLRNMSKLVRPGGKIYITVYEGSGKADEKATKSGYQLNRKTAEYMDEIQQVFPNAVRKGKLITAINEGASTGDVAASYNPNDLVIL